MCILKKTIESIFLIATEYFKTGIRFLGRGCMFVCQFYFCYFFLVIFFIKLALKTVYRNFVYLRCQSGTIRSNCLDCLDRTNSVQAFIALEVCL